MDLNWVLNQETGSSLRYAEAVETGLWLMDNCGYEISSCPPGRSRRPRRHIGSCPRST